MVGISNAPAKVRGANMAPAGAAYSVREITRSDLRFTVPRRGSCINRRAGIDHYMDAGPTNNTPITPRILHRFKIVRGKALVRVLSTHQHQPTRIPSSVQVSVLTSLGTFKGLAKTRTAIARFGGARPVFSSKTDSINDDTRRRGLGNWNSAVRPPEISAAARSRSSTERAVGAAETTDEEE
jgi:hypothetical protein